MHRGRYDDHAEQVRDVTAAAAVVVIVLDGSNGDGFSVAGDGPTVHMLPRLLELVAQLLRSSGPLAAWLLLAGC